MSKFYSSEDKLKIKYNKWILFFFFVVISIPPLQHIRMLYWLSILMIACSLLFHIISSKLKITNYVVWLLLFNMFILLSGVWSIEKKFFIKDFKLMLVISIVFIYISLIIQNKNNIYTLLKLFIYSKVIMAIYIFFNIEITSLGNVRIGAENLGEEWNANTIGMNMAISSFMVTVLLKDEKVKSRKYFYFLCVLLFCVVTLLSGSRKALFILIFSIGLYSIITSKRYKAAKATIMFLTGMILLYLVMNVSFLYDVLGSRIDTLLAKFSGSGSVDKSTAERFLMVELGMDFFKDNPLFGYGANNFRELFGNITGRYVYSHNNYVELLVGIGLIGTLIYYFGYLYILNKVSFKNDPLSAFAFVSIVVLFIIDIGLVSYNSFYIQFLICLSFSIIYVKNNMDIKGDSTLMSSNVK